MRKQLMAAAIAGLVGGGALVGVPSPAQAAPAGCNFVAAHNWVGLHCDAKPGHDILIGAFCLIPASGGQSYYRSSGWRSRDTATSAYANCDIGHWPNRSRVVTDERRR